MTLALHGFPDWQGSLQTADLEVNIDNQVLAPGAGFVTSILDLRAYNSYSLKIGTVVNNIPTAFNPVSILLVWRADAAGLNTIWRETFIIHCFQVAGTAFDVPYEEFFSQGQVQGPYLQVFVNNNGVDPITANLRLLGNSRSLPGNFVRESGPSAPFGLFNTDPLLLADVRNINAGATVTIPLRIMPGTAWMRLQNPGQPGIWTFTGASGQVVDAITQVAGTVSRQFIHLPRQSTRVSINNTGAGAGQFDTRIVGRYDLM